MFYFGGWVLFSESARIKGVYHHHLAEFLRCFSAFHLLDLEVCYSHIGWSRVMEGSCRFSLEKGLAVHPGWPVSS